MENEFVTEEFLLMMLREMQQTRTLRALGAELGVGFRMVGMVLSGERTLGHQIPAALGYEPITLYRPIKRKKGNAA